MRASVIAAAPYDRVDAVPRSGLHQPFLLPVTERGRADAEGLREFADGHRIRVVEVFAGFDQSDIETAQRLAHSGALGRETDMQVIDALGRGLDRHPDQSRHQSPGGHGADGRRHRTISARGDLVPARVAAVAVGSALSRRDDPEPLQVAHLLRRVAHASTERSRRHDILLRVWHVTRPPSRFQVHIST